MNLTAEEQRVLGSLVEKEATVPDTYPMTLNGLRTACNQSSSRDPVVSYGESDVVHALDSLKAKGLVRFVHASHGARTTKFRHVLDEALGLDRAELALLSVLLLRGAQTAGELRARTERQHAFESTGDVEATLRGLAGRDPALVLRLDRRPGQRDERWEHLLGDVAGAAAEPLGAPAPVQPTAASREVVDAGPLESRVAALEQRVLDLERRLDHRPDA